MEQRQIGEQFRVLDRARVPEPPLGPTRGGATAVGPSGGEMLSMLATAVHAEVPTDTLRSMIYAYPTFHRAVESALADLTAS